MMHWLLARWRWLIWPLLLVAAVGLTFGLGGAWQQRYWLQAQADRLEDLPNSELLPALEKLAAEGPAAWRELVAALGSSQANVALAAQQVVQEELERCEQNTPEQVAETYLALADALASQVEEFGPTTTRLAGLLAERMLRNPIQSVSADEQARWIANCGHILRFANRHTASAEIIPEENWQVTPRPVPWEVALHSLAHPEPSPANTAEPGQDISPGEGLEPRGIEVPSLPNGISSTDASAAPNSGAQQNLEPRPLPELTGETKSPEYERPEHFHKPLELRRITKQLPQQPENSPEASGRDTAAPPGEIKDGGLSPLESSARQALPRTSPGKRGGKSGPPRDETVIQLLQQLVSADQQAANRAATGLTERGLPPAQLEIARRIADPDPAIRKSLVDILPRTPGIDARPWLWWLARDEHADVRLAALTTLATSNDPQLAKQVAALASEDNDERILALAERLRKRP